MDGGRQTAHCRRRTAVGQAFQLTEEADRQRMGKRINEYGRRTADSGAQTANHRRRGFPACRGGRPSTNGERINEYGRQTAGGAKDRGRREDDGQWTVMVVGRVLDLSGGRPSTNEETNKRIWTADGRPQTAEADRALQTANCRRRGFPACRDPSTIFAILKVMIIASTHDSFPNHSSRF
jgi:hypothetical protein